MTEVVRKGIQEAQVQLQKANEERLLEEVRPPQGLPAAMGWEGAQQGHSEQWLCFTGSAAANTCSRIRAELVFSSASFTKGKNF